MAELKEQAGAALSEFILPRVRHGAVRRIREHRRRGDRVVFVTGALDFLVEPLGHLADELVAARLVEARGAFTGELLEPPLSADGRASLVAKVAADHGIELDACHAYGDSVSDLPMLETVGPPVRRQPRLPARPRGAPAPLAGARVGHRAGRAHRALGRRAGLSRGGAGPRTLRPRP